MANARVFSGTPWEERVGYCRAIKVGPHVFVSGTAPVQPGGGTHAPGDPYAQAARCFQLIEASLDKLGCKLSDVVRTRMFVTDISHWPEFGRAHAEYFGGNPPATTMVQVSRLVSPDMLIEVEADALANEP